MVPTTLLNVLDEKPFLKELSNLYAKNGFQIYLVGGAVRDGILDIETKDLVGARVIRDNGRPTKILGRGEVTVTLSITANKFTKSAKEKIEAAGGSVKVLD